MKALPAESATEEHSTRDDSEYAPLVTLFVPLFNQESYAEEAIRSAFEQSYSPLEILLSDDASTDRTFEIAQRLAAHYRGPHAVAVNRNPANLGVGRHFEMAFGRARGELVVVAAGDDVSLPDRVEALTKAWIGAGRPSGVCSAFLMVDEEGRTQAGGREWYSRGAKTKGAAKAVAIEELIRSDVGLAYGCAAAWRRDILERSVGFTSGVWAEDHALSLRSWLLDNITFVPEALVLYRQHDGNLSNARFRDGTGPAKVRQTESHIAHRARRFLVVLRDYERCLDFAIDRELLTKSSVAHLLAIHAARERATRLRAFWWEWSGAARGMECLRLIARGDGKDLKWAAARAVPFEVYVWARALGSFLKRKLFKRLTKNAPRAGACV